MIKLAIARFTRLVVLGITLFLAATSCSQGVTITSPRYALVYGVQNYLHATQLKYTLNDALSISQLLPSPDWTTKVGLDSGATREAIASDISSLAATAESNSTVLIYFSGHGDLTNDGRSGIIAPYDTDFQRNADGTIRYVVGIPQIDESTVISAPQLASMLAKFSTRNIIVVLDCCNSGAFVSPGSAIDASPQDYSSMQAFSAFATAFSNFGSLLSANATASGMKSPIVISAAGADEFSYDGSDGTFGSIVMGHGVFTYYLLKSKTEGDLNGDGVITTTEAFAYAMHSIQAWYTDLTSAQIAHFGFNAFLPHISGGTRDLVLFGP